MNPRTLALFLLSHGGLFLLGSWLAARENPATPPVTIVVAPKKSAPALVDESTANPILRATGADFQAAWAELLVGPRDSTGEPGGNSLSFFIDWCAIDPEGAVRGLGRLHAPRFAHNFLGNAVNYHGAILAPALVKHWRKLERLPDHKVEHSVGRALNELAQDAPETAATLTGDLPPGMREDVYRILFDRQDSAAIGRLLKSLPPLPPEATGEKTRLWTAVAESTDAADPQRGLWDGMARADDPIARRAFATEGMRKALKAEDWSAFFGTVEQMDAAARTEVRDLLRQVARDSAYRPEACAAISAECRRHGLDDWLDATATE